MKVGVIQMESVVGEVGRNIDAAERLIDLAAEGGSTVALLPEYWSTGFFPGSRDYRKYDLAAPDDGPAMSAIKEKASQHRLHIVASIFERDVTDLGIESIYFRTGSRYPVFSVDGWKVGLILCYDTYFPEAIRCLALAGAEVVLAPFGISDTKKTLWRELLATRAFENIAYVLAANNIGHAPAPDMPIVMGGHSIAFDPLGEQIAMASYDCEEVLQVVLDREHLQHARRLHFMFRDRRPETYGIISTPTDEIQR